MKRAIELAAKGFCMGAADVIPGVSGGTMALVLGIYRRLIYAIRSMDLTLVRSLLEPTFYKRYFGRLSNPLAPWDENETLLRADAAAFLTVLLVGIGSAIITGAKIIPALLHAYPEPMRGFFFGLVLLSIVAPMRMMKERKPLHLLILLLFTAATYHVVGLQLDQSEFSHADIVLTADNPPTDAVRIDENIRFSADNTKTLGKHDMAFQPVVPTTWPAGEKSIRFEVVATRSGADSNVDAGTVGKTWVRAEKPSDRHHIWIPITDAATNPLAQVLVTQPSPAQGGTNPSLWYLFFCGAIAICAMILPGLSGAFLLLLLGQYDYVLDALGRLISLDMSAASIVFVFMAGIAIGILSFSRFLHWLLHVAHDATMIALVGLMLGSLRRLWPFQEQNAYGNQNVLPSGLDASTGETLVAFLAGMMLVLAFLWMGSRSNIAENEVNQHPPAKSL